MPASWTPTILTATEDTSDILQTERKFDVADIVFQLEPSKAPLLRLTGGAGGPWGDIGPQIEKEVATDPDFRYFEDQLVPWITAVNNAGGYNAAATSIVVDNGAYGKIGDVVIVGRTLERWLITNAVTNTWTVTRSLGAVAAQAVNDNEEVMILSDASVEGSSAPNERMTQKVQRINYIQPIRHAWSMTRTLQNTKLYTGNDWAYQSKKALVEFAIKCERSFYWGERSQDTTTNATPRRTSGGLLEFITANVKDINNNALTENAFEDFCRQAFRYNAMGNNNQKFLLCSPLIVSAVSSWAKSRLYMNAAAKAYGMRVMTYESGAGTVHLVPSWLMQDSATFRSWGFLLDVPNIKIRYEQGSDTQVEENIQLPGDHIRRDGVFAYLGWQIALDDTHGVLQNVGGY